MKLNISRFVILPLTLGFSACGAAAGTQPHEMSAAQHQAAATREENQAAEHSSKYDSSAGGKDVRCPGGRGGVCWTRSTNPSASHHKDAEEHRKLAAAHRVASQALRDAEAQACAGLPEEDRDVSPFEHDADIQSVTLLQEERRVGKTTTKRDAGATIVFRATPGLTAEWLQRVVSCHLARNAAVGHDMPEMSACPLVPEGAQAKVRALGAGFAVDVHADDPKTAAEIWRRAQLVKATL